MKSEEVLADLKTRVEQKLSELVPADSPFFASLYQGGRYSLLSAGKRIRPLLALCTAEMLQPKGSELALVPACALEMVHCYSLIHDDLPCMDDDDFRRGKPTLHKVYTEGHAVLVGDYLLTFAFELLSRAPNLGAEQRIELVHTLAKAAGSEGMIGGQVMDIEQSPHIDETHRRKTAALFAASVSFGAIVAQADPLLLQQLHQFGLQFGQLFQMVDDLHDADHPLGKERAELALEALFGDAERTLNQLPFDTTCLKFLTESLYQQCSCPQK